MLSHDRYRAPPLLRTDSTQWHTTGQLWIRWFFSLADGARPKEVSSKAPGGLAAERYRSTCGLASEHPPKVVERPLRRPRADAIAVAK